jgi:hypothetical protein
MTPDWMWENKITTPIWNHPKTLRFAYLFLSKLFSLSYISSTGLDANNASTASEGSEFNGIWFNFQKKSFKHCTPDKNSWSLSLNDWRLLKIILPWVKVAFKNIAVIIIIQTQMESFISLGQTNYFAVSFFTTSAKKLFWRYSKSSFPRQMNKNEQLVANEIWYYKTYHKGLAQGSQTRGPPDDICVAREHLKNWKYCKFWSNLAYFESFSCNFLPARVFFW